MFPPSISPLSPYLDLFSFLSTFSITSLTVQRVLFLTDRVVYIFVFLKNQLNLLLLVCDPKLISFQGATGLQKKHKVYLPRLKESSLGF